jgi:single-stranded-DNA-specific exonuclease
MDQAGPFGTGFEPFRFMMDHVTIGSVRIIGKDESHMAMTISDAMGRLNGIAFRVVGTALGDALLQASDGRPMRVVGRLNRNRFRDQETPQLLIEDVMAIR